MEGIPSREFSSPFDEILPYAEAAASNLSFYLTRNRGSLSSEACEEVERAVLTLRKLLDEVEPIPVPLQILFEQVGLEESMPFRVTGLDAFVGNEDRSSELTPFELIRISANAAAHPLCQMLEAKRGELSLDDCFQIRKIYRNFEVLLALEGKIFPDTENLQRLKQLIFGEGSPHHDVYLLLIANYGSEEARAAHAASMELETTGIPPIANDPLEPLSQDRDPVVEFFERLSTQLRGILKLGA